MYSLRVNQQTKDLITEVSQIVGLSVSEIMRRSARKMERGKIRVLNNYTVLVTQATTGKSIAYRVSIPYHRQLDQFAVSDMEPLAPRESKHFRMCLIAACLDTREKNIARYARKKELDKEYEQFNSTMVEERYAMLAEVM